MSVSPPIESALVVGGCGVLGRRMVTELLKLDPSPKIAVFDLRTSQNRVQSPSVEYHDVDITNKEAVRAALHTAKPQVIFHTASPPAGLLDLDLYLKVNVEGTRNLLGGAKAGQFFYCACRDFEQISLSFPDFSMNKSVSKRPDSDCSILQAGTKAFVYTSSASVVHDAISDLVEADETLPLVYLPQQKEVYSHTKAWADQLVLDANSTTCGGMLTASIRPSAIFGEDEGTAKGLAERAAAGKLKVQIGTGKNHYDFTYIENVIYAHILAAQCLLENKESAAGEGFIITNDEHVPFWEFARAVGDAAGYPTNIKDVWTIPRWAGLMMAVLAEWIVWLTSFGRKKSHINTVGIRYSCMTRTYRIDKAKRILGYRPLVTLQEGIL
ncbi:Sterol-4-alpha-carboxylate 3-dehydrogenase,decarboxylating [Lachnellula subtilissima]|uniref:Sterol-4-alpha-carboxylate 3-dehydrogenase,decarboxylating n=1 Tax=Lachnellula subtilissima TaxID=602034 RepID=A0A8H8RIR2_9HELO|nr:Sterol-4-alpha-carboxylate 3-dehydrogenase,decarboxylating [Lachnellula subtilissima]